MFVVAVGVAGLGMAVAADSDSDFADTVSDLVVGVDSAAVSDSRFVAAYAAAGGRSKLAGHQ